MTGGPDVAAAERTALAWQRTGLAALVTGLIAVRAGFAAAGIALAVAGSLAVAVVAPLRLRACTGARAPAAPALLLAAAVAVTAAVSLLPLG